MCEITISNLKLGAPAYLPKDAILNGTEFLDLFRVSFQVTFKGMEKKNCCNSYHILVTINDDDDTSGDDIITVSPGTIDPCYDFEDGTYNFFVGNYTPDCKNLPANTKSAVDANASTGAGESMKPGNYKLPGWGTIDLNGDPGSEYEIYVSVELIPCCEETEISVSANTKKKYKTVKMYGRPYTLEEIRDLLKGIAGVAGSVTGFIPK